MKYTIIDGELYRTDELYHHGVKGMRWGVRKERKHRSRAERIKERSEARKARETAKQERLAYKAQTQKLKADLINKTNERLKAVQAHRELSTKMSRKDRKTISKLKGEQAVAAAKADKLQAENRMKDERKKAQGVIQKVLSKLGWSAIEGVAEAGKALVRDKLLAFGKEKLGLNTVDPDEALAKEAKRAENHMKIDRYEKSVKEKAQEKDAEEVENVAYQIKLEEISKRSSNSGHESYNHIKDGENWDKPSTSATKSREKQEEYRRLREDIKRKKAEEQTADKKRAEERDAYKKEIKRRNKKK